MTDYNDGKWHFWNGGECPVHPRSLIEYVWHLPVDSAPRLGVAGVNIQLAGPDVDCDAPDWTRIIRFRVREVYIEPREFWITLYDGMAWDTSAQAEQHNANLPDGGSQIIHVREVLE